MADLDNIKCQDNINDVSIMNISSDCLEGIREALKIAMITNQIVEVGLNCHGEPVELEGCIIDVSRRTCCIVLQDCLETSNVRDSRNFDNCRSSDNCRQRRDKREFDIEDCEYCEFG